MSESDEEKKRRAKNLTVVVVVGLIALAIYLMTMYMNR
jgi:hypothetical protein